MTTLIPKDHNRKGSNLSQNKRIYLHINDYYGCKCFTLNSVILFKDLIGNLGNVSKFILKVQLQHCFVDLEV